MRVLIAHNRYQQPGGEDGVVAAEMALMSSAGWQVELLEAHNDAVSGMSGPRVAAKSIWNGESHRRMREACERFRPDVVHVHNTLPLLSPAVFRAAADHGAAVVMTLHNYRLVCPGPLLMRDGRPCEDCVGSLFALPAIRHACYRGSRAATATVAATTAAHRVLGTWRKSIDRYIALTEFARGKFVEGGLPADRVALKPNFLAESPPVGEGGDGAVFVGRLAVDKGVRTLLEAWKDLPDVQLRIVGDGPLADEVRAAAAVHPNVEWLGHQDRAGVEGAVRSAEMLVFPSLWYEGMPMTIIESLAAGTPIVGSRIGSVAEMIEEGVNGVLFEPGDPNALVQSVRHLRSDPSRLRRMRHGARKSFECNYTATANLRHLERIYAEARHCRDQA